mmetsp:Transcript_24383/g.96731  ORF Transcript_24383/g.96731 Transcript_24383/m.96731 type:complete len:370 (+) Transcript_24383:32-1141(+)
MARGARRDLGGATRTSRRVDARASGAARAPPAAPARGGDASSSSSSGRTKVATASQGRRRRGRRDGGRAVQAVLAARTRRRRSCRRHGLRDAASRRRRQQRRRRRTQKGLEARRRRARARDPRGRRQHPHSGASRRQQTVRSARQVRPDPQRGPLRVRAQKALLSARLLRRRRPRGKLVVAIETRSRRRLAVVVALGELPGLGDRAARPVADDASRRHHGGRLDRRDDPVDALLPRARALGVAASPRHDARSASHLHDDLLLRHAHPAVGLADARRALLGGVLVSAHLVHGARLRTLREGHALGAPGPAGVLSYDFDLALGVAPPVASRSRGRSSSSKERRRPAAASSGALARVPPPGSQRHRRRRRRW